MRHSLLAAAVLALMVPPMGRADDADAEKQVAVVSKQSREALVKGDTKALDSLLADEWVGINPRGDIGTRAQQAKDLKDGSIDFEAIDPDEVKIRVYGDAALVMGRYHVKLAWKGEKIDQLVRTNEVYVKQGGKWRCVSTQVTGIGGPPGEKR